MNLYLCLCCFVKDETSSELSVRLKEVEEERSRYQRTSSSQQMQIDKYKRLAEETKGKADSLDNQLSAVKKVGLMSGSSLTSLLWKLLWVFFFRYSKWPPVKNLHPKITNCA